MQPKLIGHRPPFRSVAHVLFSTCVILSLLASTVAPALAASTHLFDASRLLQEVDPTTQIIALADQSLESTPLRLRRTAYDTLLSLTLDETVPPYPQGDDVLPLALVNRINEDNLAYFFDEARVTSPLVLSHDWDLVQHLSKLTLNHDVDPDAKAVYLAGLLLILKADRHVAELALQDASVVVAGAESGTEIAVSDLNRSQARLNTAQIEFDNGIAALSAGDPDHASHHFYTSWQSSGSVLSIWSLVYDADRDQDGVIDVVEFRIGSSPFAKDTDRDGLPDVYEINSLIPHTLPNNSDTDGDGVVDGNEDLDADELTNLSEYGLKTDPLLKDTDQDTLSDGVEADAGLSDPTVADTDEDGLRDDSELRLETDPRNPDSDGDGILDGADVYAQVLSDAALGVTVNLIGVGDQSLGYQIQRVDGISGFDDAPGLIGSFIDISTEQPIVSARVTLSYDPELVPDGDFANLRLFHFNPQTGIMEELPDQSIDLNAHTITATATSFSPFGVMYMPTRDETINEPAMRIGFDANTYGPNDDGTYPCVGSGAGTPWNCYGTRIPLGFPVSFFGQTYNDLYLNNNGNITFDQPLYTYTPFDLTTTQRVIIAAFFADVDTRSGNLVKFGTGAVDGHNAFGINWPAVGCYSNNVAVLNDFQMVLIDRSDIQPGDFDIEFNYRQIQWETGQASGGNTLCQGGASARVGYSNGTRLPGTFYELPGSGIQGAFLDANLENGLIHSSLNSSITGRYIFTVRNGAPQPDLDSDQDSLTDAQETSGIRTGFGNLIYTLPYNPDTDGDGLWDGDEVTGGPDLFSMLADPTKPDTDGDGVDDFVELHGLEQSLDPFNGDWDHDELDDGDELYDYNTDPFSNDTDGDDVWDGTEVNDGEDPLLPTERMDALKVTTEFLVGAVCGEFCVDDPAHGNMAFFSGFLIAGSVSAIPTPVTWVVGLLADLRDFVASLVKGDWGSLALNAAALIPDIGDVADVVGSVAKFALKHPELIGGIAIFVTRLDALPEVAKIQGVIASVGDQVVNSLVAKGLSHEKLVRLAKAGVKLDGLETVLARVLGDYPGMARYLDDIPASRISDSTGVLRSEEFTANLKAAGTNNRHALSNLIGAYSENVLRTDRVAQGWNIIHELPRVNAGGYDFVLQSGSTIRLVESKARSTLRADDFLNYFRKDAMTGDLIFNSGYFAKQPVFNNSAVQGALTSNNLEIEIFINNPASTQIAQSLANQLGTNIVKFNDLATGTTHTINLIITAVTK